MTKHSKEVFLETLLKVPDLAARLGCSKSKIYRLRSYCPELLPPSIKLGNQVRYRLEDVEAWEAEQIAKAREAVGA